MTDLMDEEQYRALLQSAPPSHPGFVGPEPDASGLDRRAIGRLMPELFRLRLHGNERSGAAHRAANVLQHRIEVVPPLYDDIAATETLTVLCEVAASQIARRAAEKPGDNWHLEWVLKAALEVLCNLRDGRDARLRTALVELARLPLSSEENPMRLALAAAAGGEVAAEAERTRESAFGDQPIRLMETRLIAELMACDPCTAARAALMTQSWINVEDDEAVSRPGEYPLAAIPSYVKVARDAIERATVHVAAIQAGDVAYASDKAFTIDSAASLGRFVSVALDREEPWLDPLLSTLLPGVCLAPKPTVKTVPSQSAANQIARAIAERPTPSALETLKRTAGDVRHAGVKKKLARHIKKAERRFYQRPDFIFMMPAGASLPKSLQTTAKRALENLFRTGAALPVSEFEMRLLANKTMAGFASKLVWTIRLPSGAEHTVMPVKSRRGWRYCNAAGDDIETSGDGNLMLWHPLTAAPEDAEAWRAIIIERGRTQPFNQVFREVYVLTDDDLAIPRTDLFNGYEAEAHVLIGLAHASGWTLDKFDGFKLSVRPFQFHFHCGELYPGYRGVTFTRDIRAFKDLQPVPFGEINPVLVSEVLRAVDLLVSVAAFAVDQNDLIFEFDWRRLDDWAGPCGPVVRPTLNEQSARARREVLRRLFGEQPRTDRPWVDGRYVRHGSVAIHIATGYARQDGVPIASHSALDAIQLPYEDAVLNRIVAQLNAGTN
ncbi:MAG: DUF4132 domain-containing protein [Hyphomicrobiaceae bacterium]